MLQQPSFTLRGHSKWINAVVETDSEDKIITASLDGTVKLWSLPEKKCIRTFSSSINDVTDVAVVYDTAVVTVCGYEACVLRIEDGRIMARSTSFRNRLWSCSVLSATTAIVGDNSGSLFKIAWKLGNNNIKILKRKKAAHDDWINQIIVRGDKLATCSGDNTVKLWDANSLTLLQTFRDYDDYVHCVAFSDQYLVCGTHCMIQIHNVRTASHISSISFHDNFVQFVHIVESSNIIVSGSWGGHVASHELLSGELIAKHDIDLKIRSVRLLQSGLLAVADYNSYDINVFHIQQLCQLVPTHQKHSKVEKDWDSLVTHQEHSKLEQALNDVLSQPETLTIPFILNTIRADNILSASDLYCAHNLVLLAIRCGVITQDELRMFNRDIWFFEENLYYPASKLVLESGDMLYPIFQHAQHVGIIRDGHSFRREHEMRVDTNMQFESMRTSLDRLQARLSNVEDVVQTNAMNFQFLFEAIKKKEKLMRYVGFAKVLLSLIPLLGKSFGDAAYAGADVLFSLSAEDIVETGIEMAKAGLGEVANVDLSNAQVIYCVLSERRMGEMSEDTRTIITSAVRQSGFKYMDVLRGSLKEVIQESAQKECRIAMLDMGSSEWLDNDEGIKETEEKKPYDECTCRHQFRAIAVGRKKGALSIEEATVALNMVLAILEISKQMSEPEFDAVFMSLSDELEVSEEMFVDVFKAVTDNVPTFDENYWSDVYAEKFDETNVGRETTSITFAARTLNHVCKELCNQEALGDTTISDVNITPAMIGKFDVDGDGEMDRNEFVTAALFILHGVERS